MLKHLNLAFTCLAISMSSFTQEQNTNTLPGIQIKKKLSIEFQDGHECMTQTRAATKEEALYSIGNCGPVKYELTKNGKFFSIHMKNDKDRWYESGTFRVLHSFSDTLNGNERITFLCADGSSITYVPKMETGPLVILDLVGDEVVYFNYN